MNLLFRLMFLIAVAFLAAALCVWTQLMFLELFPPPTADSWIQIPYAVAGTIVAAVVSSLPTAVLFPRHIWIAALVVASPVIAGKASDVAFNTGALEQHLMLVYFVESALYAGAVVIGALLVSRGWTLIVPGSSGTPKAGRSIETLGRFICPHCGRRMSFFSKPMRTFGSKPRSCPFCAAPFVSVVRDRSRVLVALAVALVLQVASFFVAQPFGVLLLLAGAIIGISGGFWALWNFEFHKVVAGDPRHAL